LPANHIGGLAVLLRAILADASLHWGDVDDLEDAARQGATHVALVATQLARHDTSGFYRVLLGGARPPSGLADNVVTTWGMTETGSGIVYNRFALPGVEIAAPNGELLVRSPTLFRSYRSMARPRATGPDGRDDWFPTGDAGEVVDGRVQDVAVTAVEDPEWGERVVALVVSDRVSLNDAISSIAGERIGPWAKPKEIHYVESIPRTANGKIRRGDLRHLL
jgi:O-succinylbenzoic acid--CoA ligase